MLRVPVSPASSNRRIVSGESRASRDGKRERAKDRELDLQNPFTDYSIPTTSQGFVPTDINNATISLHYAPNSSTGSNNHYIGDAETKFSDNNDQKVYFDQTIQNEHFRQVILERDSAISATKALEVKLMEIRHHVQEMTEALENQEALFRRKLKSRRLKFDRKITRSRLMVKDRNVLLGDWINAIKKNGIDGEYRILIERSFSLIAESKTMNDADKQDQITNNDNNPSASQHHTTMGGTFDRQGDQEEYDEYNSSIEQATTNRNTGTTSPSTTHRKQQQQPKRTASRPQSSPTPSSPRAQTPVVIRLGPDGQPLIAQQSRRMQKYLEDRKSEEQRKAEEAARRERLGRYYDIYDPVTNNKLLYDYRGKLIPAENFSPPEVASARRKRIQERRKLQALAFGSGVDRCLTSDMSDYDDDVTNPAASTFMMSSMANALMTSTNSNNAERVKEYSRVTADGEPHYAMSPRRYSLVEEERRKAEAEERHRQRVGQHFDIVGSDGKKMVYNLEGVLVTEEQYQLQLATPRRPQTTNNNNNNQLDLQHRFRPMALSPGENKGYHGGYDPARRRTLRVAPSGSPRESIDLTWVDSSSAAAGDER